MNIRSLAALALPIAAICTSPAPIKAQEPIRIGFIGEMTGPFADFGLQILTGMKVYMQQHGDVVAGRKIEVVVRDVGGPSPEVAKRLAQELVTRNKVDFLAGFGFSPNALSVAPVATEAKVPTVIMNAAASVIPSRSPYIVRTSMTTAHTATGTAQWAIRNGIKTAYTIVIDYAPGHDAETAFVTAFKKLGGEIAGSLRVPLSSVEFGPFVQRVKDAKPDALFSFINAGNPGAAFLKAVKERGLVEAGIKPIGTGDTVFETVLDVAGDSALGMISVYPYSAAHPSERNKTFVAGFAALIADKTVPTIMAVSGYDGMAAIYEVVRRLGGTIDGDKAMGVLRGLVIDSPRGKIMIDAETRDVVQGLYARRVERVGNRLMNVEFEVVSPGPN
jgi:branched-chain amino acid transport system substrate-binding protein